MTITNKVPKLINAGRIANFIAYILFLIVWGITPLSLFTIFVVFVQALCFYTIENFLVKDTNDDR